MRKISFSLIFMLLFTSLAYADEEYTDVFEEYASVTDEVCKTSPVTVKTAKNSVVTGEFPVECEGDFYVEITKKPKMGTVGCNGIGFIYTPNENKSGTDEFYYRISTGTVFSNISKCTVIIESDEKEIEVFDTSFEYFDMVSNPAREASEKLVELGVLKGERIGRDYYFHPESKVTRETAINCINSALKIGDASADASVLSVFSDSLTLHEQTRKNASIAFNIGIISGKEADGKYYLGAADCITRAELITMLDRALGTKTLSETLLPYADSSLIPDYAVNSVKNLAGADMLSVFGNNLIKPYDEVTRAEFASLLYEAVKYNEKRAQKTLSQRIKDGFYRNNPTIANNINPFSLRS